MFMSKLFLVSVGLLFIQLSSFSTDLLTTIHSNKTLIESILYERRAVLLKDLFDR